LLVAVSGDLRGDGQRARDTENARGGQHGGSASNGSDCVGAIRFRFHVLIVSSLSRHLRALAAILLYDVKRS
jgi:hypothetical protein